MDANLSIAITGAGTTYTDAVKLQTEHKRVEGQVNMTTFTGAGTLDVTPQMSYDGGSTWHDAVDDSDSAITVTQFTAAANNLFLLTRPALQVRFKLVAGGTPSDYQGTINLVARQ